MITFMVTFTTSIFYASGALDRVEWLSFDWRMKEVREGSSASPEIAVVLIDDASLKALEPVAGRFPWPRWVYADLLEYFAAAGPKAVLFDILFTEKQIESKDDQRLVDATAANPYVYHASRFLIDKEDELNKSLLNKSLPPNFVERFDLSNRLGLKNGVELEGIELNSNNLFYLPHDALLGTMQGTGAVDVNPDFDGIYRHVRPIQRYHDHYFPALSTTAFIDGLGPKTIHYERKKLSLGDVEIPLDSNGHYLLNYYDNYTTYSLSGIIASLQMMYAGELENLLVSPLEFENKIVFIGASAAGLDDLKNTPVDANLPGVLIHATAASNLLQRDFIHYPNSLFVYLLILIFAGSVSTTTLLSRHAVAQNSVPIVLSLGYIAWCFWGLEQNTFYNLTAPVLSIVLSWAASFSSLLLLEGREKRRFKKMMSQYLSPAVLNEVVNKHEEFAHAEVGRKENVSMLFSDIRGFTNMSEHFPAEVVVEILNHYFSQMTDAIFLTQGTIDKFIGDAIMAFWGAPIRTETHAKDATLASLEMLERLKEVKIWLKEKKYPSLSIGIGLHTGDVILGNIGSEQKLDYTIIGDNVNLASRVEGLTKNYGCEILLTESTYNALAGFIPCRKVDLVRVKGKNKPIGIYQPLVNPTRAGDKEFKVAELLAQQYQEAFTYYLEKKWEQVESILKTFPEDDYPTKIILERCRSYKIEAPPDDWDGVFTMTTK